MELTANCLRADNLRTEAKLWQAWMDEAAKHASRFYAEENEEDPFRYGETASVGFLASAAARLDYLALPEFAITKKALWTGGYEFAGAQIYG